jgi:putative transposase
METFLGRLKNEIYYGYEKEYRSFSEFSEVNITDGQAHPIR